MNYSTKGNMTSYLRKVLDPEHLFAESKSDSAKKKGSGGHNEKEHFVSAKGIRQIAMIRSKDTRKYYDALEDLVHEYDDYCREYQAE